LLQFRILTITPKLDRLLERTAPSSSVKGRGRIPMRRGQQFFYALLLVFLTVWFAGCSAFHTNVAKGAAADFSLQLGQASASVTAGGAAQAVMINALAAGGFTGSVQVTVTGLPAGVTATPATFTLAAGGAAQQVSLTASSTAAAGSATIVFSGTSGSVTHTVSLALTVNGASSPTPDFSFQVSPTSATLTAGGAAQSATLTALAANGFTGAVQVSIGGLPANVTATPSTLTLSPGVGQAVSLAAAGSASAGTATIVFTGTSGALTHTASLGLTVTTSPPPPPSGSVDVTTYHFDGARTGLNPNETTLTTSNVASATFGLIRSLPVDGHVDAQALYLSGVTIGGQSHDVVYAASEHGSVYAFDADTGAQLWKTSILESGETTSDDHGCSQITPEIGITSTPVIDRKAGTNGAIFVVGMSEDQSGHYHQRLHALDLTTGAEISGSPVEIAATYPGTGANSSGGKVIFDPGQYAVRAGLLLLNGTIYMGWTSHCDLGPYSGWLMGYSESTLAQTTVLNLTPNGSQGSIWMAGAGLAADASGNIYFLDANGTFDTTLNSSGFPANADFGNAFIKVSTSGGSLSVADYFETSNTVSESAMDTDLGSGGALVLPDLQDTSGTVHHLAVGAGKDSNIYVVNRDSMGKFNAQNDNAIYQEIPGAIDGVFSMPAYFNNTVYYGAVNDNLKAFPITNAKLATSASVQSANNFQYPGTTPAISANGTANGIVWAVENSSPAVLHAYDAASLQELYNSNQAASSRDHFGNGNKFITPMIANGKVFVGTPNSVAEFGLLQ
jgi:outer membrane protein assembly factor BamB